MADSRLSLNADLCRSNDCFDYDLPLDHSPARSNGAGVHVEVEQDFCANCAIGCPSRGTSRMFPDVELIRRVRGTPKADTVIPVAKRPRHQLHG